MYGTLSVPGRGNKAVPERPGVAGRLCQLMARAQRACAGELTRAACHFLR